MAGADENKSHQNSLKSLCCRSAIIYLMSI